MDKKKIKIFVTTIIAVLAIAFGIAGTWLFERSFLKLDGTVVEAGDTITAHIFLKDGKKKSISFAKDNKEIDTAIPGKYNVKLKVKLFTFDCKVEVRDTIAPTADVVTVYYEPGEEVLPEAFLENVNDETATSIEYVNTPNFNESGANEVQIRIRDAGGNETILTSKMIIRAVKKEIILEAGDAFPDIKDFLKIEDNSATFVTEVAEIDTKKIGNYEIKIKVNEIEYVTSLIIKDTKAPEVTVRDVTVFDMDGVSPEAFIESVVDATNYTIAFENEVGTAMTGEKTVSILVTDEANNVTKKEAQLTVIHDNEAPALLGVNRIVSFLGDSIDYFAGVSATDNHDKDLKINVNAAVDVNKEGSYTVEYSVSDMMGNRTTKNAEVVIIRDTEAPIISGVKDVVAILGERTSFTSGITVTDNHDRNVQLNVDSSAVNIGAVGKYPITYTATDSVGNTSTISATVNVVVQMSSLYPYLIRVNKLANCVTVYTQDENTGDYTVPFKAFVCSCGGGNTPEGTFTISNRYVWRPLIHNVYGQYATRIYKGILFHSVPYTRMSKDALEIDEFNKLGETASAGCIRLTVEDSKWIYDNVPSGTTVVIYSDSNPGPLGKPTAPVITNGIGWDPTDPDASNPNR